MERESVVCKGEEVETVTVGSGAREAFRKIPLFVFFSTAVSVAITKLSSYPWTRLEANFILGLEVVRRCRAMSRTAFVVLASWYFITRNIPSRVRAGDILVVAQCKPTDLTGCLYLSAHTSHFTPHCSPYRPIRTTKRHAACRREYPD